jgi:hypothetical protein
MITINTDVEEFIAILQVNIDGFFKRGTHLKGKYLLCRGYVCTGMSMPNARN